MAGTSYWPGVIGAVGGLVFRDTQDQQRRTYISPCNRQGGRQLIALRYSVVLEPKAPKTTSDSPPVLR